MASSAEWHSRLGPLEIGAGIRYSQLDGAFPARLPALPGAPAAEPPGTDPPPAARLRGAEDEVPDGEPEGGTTV